MTRFWLGGYSAEMQGTSTGINTLATDESGRASSLAVRGTAVHAQSPSWLAQHPVHDIVYAVQESSDAVTAYRRSGEDSLEQWGESIAVGHGPCHAVVAADASALIVSNYGDGHVVRIGIAADGRLGRATAASLATDPYGGGAEERQPHAHAAAFLPDGRIATTDLGYDLVRIWRLTTAGLTIDHEVTLPRGTGPRHMVVHPSGHLHVVTEYSCEVFTLAAGRDGCWSVVASTLTTPVAVVGNDYPAELAMSRDGETLYTALRGSNTIAALRVRGAGETVEPVAVTDSGVDWPRHHLVHEGVLLVAGQRSDTITVIDLDSRTGVPGSIRNTIDSPTPTHFLLAR
ncbi:lactonase family protein [Microbacterium sp. YY-01]|uniref:lactonase family protein n=1 Tax=Microbacterium sp. YY-01 TaxID=3421634 RepID=UPI003D176689